jgi:uncharacterized protein with von Willebrand factor type A (vWA) domain
MSEKFFKREFIPPEERKLHQLKGKNLKEVIEYLEGQEAEEDHSETGKKEWEEYLNREGQSIFDGFLDLLRGKGVRVSTPEWLQFLQVVGQKTSAEDLKGMVGTEQLLNKIRLFAQTTLVKDKADESAFHEAFDEYFELAAKVYSHELQDEKEKEDNSQDSRDSGVEPEMKEQLGIDEVDENLDLPEGKEHDDDEQKHGGKEDQHNDILKKEDLAKKGGGDKKDGETGEGDKGKPSEGEGKEGEAGHREGEKGEAGKGKGDKGEVGEEKGDKGEPSGMGQGGKEGMENKDKTGLPPESTEAEQKEVSQEGFLVGGGKGKSVYAERVQSSPITHEGESLTKKDITEREKRVGKVDRRQRYEARPDKASMREVIRNLRRIITDVSEVKSSDVDLKRTVKNFARRDFRFDYEREREKQPEVVLLIDVGGPVDEWSPLMKEVTEEMAKGLTKLEVYLFHNNLYGYVWKPDPKDLLASSYAKPNSLIDVKKVIKKRKKVIIYGDAEMSYSEFESDGWPPSGNDERVEKFGMRGDECLNFIKKKADSVVWINPVFAKEWQERDDSGTIEAISDIVPMHDLTVGGVEDAIKELMKKK